MQMGKRLQGNKAFIIVCKLKCVANDSSPIRTNARVLFTCKMNVFFFSSVVVARKCFFTIRMLDSEQSFTATVSAIECLANANRPHELADWLTRAATVQSSKWSPTDCWFRFGGMQNEFWFFFFFLDDSNTNGNEGQDIYVDSFIDVNRNFICLRI